MYEFNIDQKELLDKQVYKYQPSTSKFPHHFLN